jgi:hypothetical protein
VAPVFVPYPSLPVGPVTPAGPSTPDTPSIGFRFTWNMSLVKLELPFTLVIYTCIEPVSDT